jgi:hypothetical protein
MRTRGERLLKLLNFILVGKGESVQVRGSSDFELGDLLALLYADGYIIIIPQC